ncbi:MAG: TetR/AcrR family transcriptional regulator [Alphaproteobacteria bacterium]|nr:TetR/AcrR family transcriptional regulator [Alphaproteobacteria bacterium]MDE1986753.1 TetR/AcrR family transcriptional regulator [Alphaproteobacteria bacterium]MDE2162437.1 TetR/AcrR family transcriptional regulator [Alphaproteobacteria bacterium]MDE2266201.1 TetR/AcrR family transcriptional regulator [Alphaproteobacteria bacterium]
MDVSLLKSPLLRATSPGKREQTKVQNRQLILDAARQVFAELGYGATTVRDIIRATPLASGTFYNYFKSKEEVFQAIRDEVAIAIRPRLHEERMKAKTVEEFISCSFRTFFEYVSDDRVNFRAIRHSADSTRVRMDTPEVIAGFEELRTDIESATAKGLFPPVDADYLMAAIVGVAFELGERMLEREPQDPVAAAEFATALFMGGLRSLPYAAEMGVTKGNA